MTVKEGMHRISHHTECEELDDVGHWILLDLTVVKLAEGPLLAIDKDITIVAPASYTEANVALEIDASNEGDMAAQTLPTITSYKWASHEVGEYITCFRMGSQL
ncbi:hypothetical protein LR48_Vigan05g022200 [Vigna angularis]|uniref:Uncharacterized protein n=1 Tax=Phaseolus angularis TaxID=3914 RepID=A0A0L9UIN0_PHAAN|nr:hypothetical protein LR48_Vigan05g022200 [Vigna angularis]